MREGGALPVWCGPIRGVPGSRPLGPGTRDSPGGPASRTRDHGTVGPLLLVQ
ncbi:hypothetical protein B0T26DRAFT_728508 [Lasiosphaeria miniovina]|uniref:Uncharacterized protein n=1 Tax=Lasiosphaeria miniovina TaxID=1954250 RepID=A0AA40A095_9PEZI|nr:uncharacterized protein B0T26DRAFT_728508 [Lasiosphaeria miniovina]KAK0706902.1 hypothetical protein B0T26DRAFT_728508 [Lasiosphaeria miniovina]